MVRPWLGFSQLDPLKFIINQIKSISRIILSFESTGCSAKILVPEVVRDPLSRRGLLWRF